jgi:hypothetical protein
MDLIELASTPFEAVPEFKRSPETFAHSSDRDQSFQAMVITVSMGS